MATMESSINLTQGSSLLNTPQKIALGLYGISSYCIGSMGLVAIILALAGVIPLGFFPPVSDNFVLAIAINVALTFVFGLQHSIMARPWFKHYFNRLFGEAAERSTFIWTSGVCAFVIVACWQPIDGTIWRTETIVVKSILWAGFLFGWTYLMAATFSINHWDLFGLRQIWFAINDMPYSPPVFKETWMYRLGRHPIMLGVLIGVWCLPSMSATQLVLSITFTAYIFIGVAFEERDLIKQFGQTYIDYKKRVGMFFTF